MFVLSFFNKNLIFIFSGLAIFLFSLDQIKKVLENQFSNKIKIVIQSHTDTKFKSFFVGAIGSAIIQSSSGITAIAISLFTTKYINKKTCLGIIIGANLGTCLTTFIAAIDISNMSLIIIILSFFCYIFINKFKVVSILCFFIGLMLLGLDFVNYGFTYIINNHSVKYVINNIQNSVTLSTLFGILSTAIIQSSSGIISIVEQMYSSNIISLSCSIAIMLGANIGTTFTGYLATINSPKQTKQIINLNLLFNVLGVLVFIILFNPFTSFINFLQNKYFLYNVKLTIAFSHFIFNFISVVLAYMFFDLFESFITKKVDKKEKNDIILS